MSEISKIVRTTLAALKEKLVPIFLPPLSPTDLVQKAEEFYKKWNFPNCAGAIDGKHIRILCPQKSASLYFNYKGFFSVVLLAIVDANCTFMYIDVGSYGKEGDSGIFERSYLGKKFNAGTVMPQPNQLPHSDLVLPYVFVGDDAFRLHPNMMKPYPRETAIADKTKAVFNYRLSRTRRTSENAFGLLSQVFRIFHTPINLLPETVDYVIIVCCCLHNMLREAYLSQSGTASYELDPTEEPPKDNLINFARAAGYANYEGFAVRNSYATYFSNVGIVGWQDRQVNRTDI